MPESCFCPEHDGDRIGKIKARLGSISPDKKGELALTGNCCYTLITEDIPWLIKKIEEKEDKTNDE